MTEIFWFHDPNILFSNHLPMLPTTSTPFITKLNIYARLIFLVGIVFFIIHPSLKYIAFILVGQLIVYMVFRKNEISEHFDSIENNLQNEFRELDNVRHSKYICPTKDNPCMNILLPEYRQQPNRVSCFMDKTKKNIPNDIKNMLKSESCLFKDISDIYGNVSTHRPFYTMPSTSIPNKQDEFANWLYGNNSN
jgi:hypothetical protein